jgi:hypothetical protein
MERQQDRAGVPAAPATPERTWPRPSARAVWDTRHCDDYIDDPSQPECLRRFLDYHCRPAALKYPTGDAAFDLAIEERHGLPMWRDPVPTLFADCEGERVRVTMASSFGDVGVTMDLKGTSGWDVRVPVGYLTGFSETADAAA